MSISKVSVIVPAYRDAALIQKKIADLYCQDYPKEYFEIIVALGGCEKYKVKQISEDRESPLVRIVYVPGAGKIRQINHALRIAYGELVMVTDADARLSPGVIRWMNRSIENGADCVGVWTVPTNCLLFDKVYWYVANWIRFVEAKLYSASHVTGPCYMFKKCLFPDGVDGDDVIADDVHIPFTIAFAGGRTDYLRGAVVYETRNPLTVVKFLRHKGRKGLAFLRELYRFYYRLPQARLRWKIIFLLRLFQYTVLTPTLWLMYPWVNQDRKMRAGK